MVRFLHLIFGACNVRSTRGCCMLPRTVVEIEGKCRLSHDRPQVDSLMTEWPMLKRLSKVGLDIYRNVLSSSDKMCQETLS